MKLAAAAAACIEDAAANQESMLPKWCGMIGGAIEGRKRLWPSAKDMSLEVMLGDVFASVLLCNESGVEVGE